MEYKKKIEKNLFFFYLTFSIPLTKVENARKLALICKLFALRFMVLME